MSQRHEQHRGRSQGDDHDARDLVGRDVRDGDATADRAGTTRVPMPNEEGTNFRVGQSEGPDAGAQGDGDGDVGPDPERYAGD